MGSDTGSTSETRPKHSLSKPNQKQVIIHQSKFWWPPGEGLVKWVLSVPMWTVTVLTIESFPDNITLNYTPVQDVISKGNTEVELGRGRQRKERKMARWGEQGSCTWIGALGLWPGWHEMSSPGLGPQAPPPGLWVFKCQEKGLDGGSLRLTPALQSCKWKSES